MIVRVLWQGVVKIGEETAELGVEAAKLQAYPEGPHPDGRGVCIERVKEEMADVMAIIDWFCERHDIELDRKRIASKRAIFDAWDMDEGLAGVVILEESKP